MMVLGCARGLTRPNHVATRLLLGLLLAGPLPVARTMAAEAAVEPAAASATARPSMKLTEPGRKPMEAALAPYLAVRSLQVLQDQVARGSTAAQAAEPKLLAHIADVFASADPAAWKDSRNLHAAVLYLFSAGKPAAVRAALDGATTLTPDGSRLLKGALAYAEGADDTARALLGTFDPRALPQSVGGHLALVLATLYADQDPRKAGQMLDAARLLVPGTLVEEAALRRQVFLLADPASLDKFVALSRQYVRRFHASVFAGNFKARLVSFAERLAVSGDIAELTKLDTVLAELPRADARGIDLKLARDALVAGRSTSARYAAGRAAALVPDAADALRAKLYLAASSVATDDAAAARTALRALDGGRLSPGDEELRDAALAVSASVDAEVADPGQAAEQRGVAPDASATALIKRAHGAMAATDALLGAAP